MNGAEFSPCRTFRYALWRTWGENCQRVAFIGLNPSTANETEDDPTIRRCIGFAKAWGFGGLVMLNAYAFRTTSPKVLVRMRAVGVDVVGPKNREVLGYYRSQCQQIIACWGAHCSHFRESQIKVDIGHRMDCLGTTKAGRPKHPLYLPDGAKPELWWSPDGDSVACSPQPEALPDAGAPR